MQIAGPIGHQRRRDGDVGVRLHGQVDLIGERLEIAPGEGARPSGVGKHDRVAAGGGVVRGDVGHRRLAHQPPGQNHGAGRPQRNREPGGPQQIGARRAVVDSAVAEPDPPVGTHRDLATGRHRQLDEGAARVVEVLHLAGTPIGHGEAVLVGGDLAGRAADRGPATGRTVPPQHAVVGGRQQEQLGRTLSSPFGQPVAGGGRGADHRPALAVEAPHVLRLVDGVEVGVQGWRLVGDAHDLAAAAGQQVGHAVRDTRPHSGGRVVVVDPAVVADRVDVAGRGRQPAHGAERPVGPHRTSNVDPAPRRRRVVAVPYPPVGAPHGHDHAGVEVAGQPDRWIEVAAGVDPPRHECGRRRRHHQPAHEYPGRDPRDRRPPPLSAHVRSVRRSLSLALTSGSARRAPDVRRARQSRVLTPRGQSEEYVAGIDAPAPLVASRLPSSNGRRDRR